MNQVSNIFKNNLNRGLASLVVLATVFGTASLEAQSEKFGPYLLRAMETTDAPLPVVVVMEPVPASSRSFWDEPTPGDIEYQKKSAALQIQWELRSFVNEWLGELDFAGDPLISNYAFLWSTNSMLGKLSQSLIWEIAQMESVTRVIYDRKMAQVNPEGLAGGDGGDEIWSSAAYTYGLSKIGVPEIRDSYPELDGSGVVVGILDTGIDANHPELKGKVVAWKDFIDGKPNPYDGNGHGTHVAGTIAGEGVNGTQIGIAPQVKLVIGKILSDRGSGSVSGILRGMDWVANPERKLNTQLRPKVVNNSWGGSMAADVRKNPFAQQVMTWVELGIFPAFAAGNAGPGKSTIGTPANLPGAFAVGATDDGDNVARFSSRGPVQVTDKDGKKSIVIKPDISAPGAKILSAWPNGGYNTISGTSMACPHLAGAVAVIYQANPNLNIQQVVELLTKTSEDRGEEGRDNKYGEGRLNLFKAVDLMTSFF